MARIRTIKPEFWTSEDVVECSTTARLLFIGLWNFCDDYGVHPYSLKTIKMSVFPGDSFTLEDIDSWMKELVKADLIRTYHIENKRYFIVTGWHHQKIDKPSHKYPLPEKFDEQSPNDRQPFGDGSPAEGKGRESIGKEKEKEEETQAPLSLEAKNLKEKPFVLPDYIPKETWKEYLKTRDKKKAVKTDYALNLIILELEKIKNQYGHDPVDVLNKSIKSGWIDVYPLKQSDPGYNGNGNGQKPWYER